MKKQLLLPILCVTTGSAALAAQIEADFTQSLYAAGTVHGQQNWEINQPDTPVRAQMYSIEKSKGLVFGDHRYIQIFHNLPIDDYWSENDSLSIEVTSILDIPEQDGNVFRFGAKKDNWAGAFTHVAMAEIWCEKGFIRLKTGSDSSFVEIPYSTAGVQAQGHEYSQELTFQVVITKTLVPDTFQVKGCITCGSFSTGFKEIGPVKNEGLYRSGTGTPANEIFFGFQAQELTEDRTAVIRKISVTPNMNTMGMLL